MSNCKPKMSHSLRRVLLVAAVVTATILAGSCEAQDGPGSPDPDGPPPAIADGQDQPGSSVLPVPSAKPGESGAVDINNQPVTGGVASFVSPLARPFRWTAFEVLDFFLRNFIGQKLPCTIWSVVPSRVACSKLDGPTM